MANIINLGTTWQSELTNAGILNGIVDMSTVSAIINLAKNHDASRVVVPDVVTNLQLRIEMANRVIPVGAPGVVMGLVAGNNMFTEIDKFVHASGNVEMILRWNASNMERHNPMLIGQAQALLGYSEVDMDAVFISAAAR